MMLTEKQQKISALSAGKIDEHEYLTDKEILPSNQSQMIEQVKFTYYPFWKAFENKETSWCCKVFKRF